MSLRFSQKKFRRNETKLIKEELRRRLRMVDLRTKESSRNLYVVFSMDCERIATFSPWTVRE